VERQWGGWTFEQGYLGLRGETGPQIKLASCGSPEKLLLHIFSLVGHVSAEDLGHLVKALGDLLHPEITFCDEISPRDRYEIQNLLGVEP
jgi:hypothetical protein